MNQLNFKTSELRELVELAEERGDEFINLDETMFAFGTSWHNCSGGQFLMQLEPNLIINRGARRVTFKSTESSVQELINLNKKDKKVTKDE